MRSLRGICNICQRLDMLNKDREYQAFEVGQIVYMCHALEMMCAQWRPHAAIPSVAPNMMHSGTNRNVAPSKLGGRYGRVRRASL